MAADGARVKKDDRGSGEKNRHYSPVFCEGSAGLGQALGTHAMDPLKFGEKSFADTIRVAIASGDPADIGSVDIEFAGYPSVDPAMQKMPGKKRVSVGLTIVGSRFPFHSQPLCTQFLPTPFRGLCVYCQRHDP